MRVGLHPGPTCSIYVRDTSKFSHIQLAKDSHRIQIAMGHICCLLEPLCSLARAWFDADIVVCVYLLQNKSTLKITTPSSILRALGQSLLREAISLLEESMGRMNRLVGAACVPSDDST